MKGGSAFPNGVGNGCFAHPDRTRTLKPGFMEGRMPKLGYQAVNPVLEWDPGHRSSVARILHVCSRYVYYLLRCSKPVVYECDAVR